MADYTTFQRISTRLGGTLAASHTLFVDSKIAVASRAIDKWCGQQFAPEQTATARTFRPQAADICKTDPFWTDDGLAVEVDTAGDGTYAAPVTGFWLERFGGDMADMLGAPFDRLEAPSVAFPVRSTRSRTVRVTAKWGWAEVPAVVSEACEILTVELWHRKDTPFGITASSTDFGGLRIGRDVMAQCASLLQELRRMDRVAGIA